MDLSKEDPPCEEATQLIPPDAVSYLVELSRSTKSFIIYSVDSDNHSHYYKA